LRFFSLLWIQLHTLLRLGVTYAPFGLVKVWTRVSQMILLWLVVKFGGIHSTDKLPTGKLLSPVSVPTKSFVAILQLDLRKI
jgi:hypothetical protein